MSGLWREEFSEFLFDLFAGLALAAGVGEAEGLMLADGAESEEGALDLGLARVAAGHRFDGLEAGLDGGVVLGSLAGDAFEAGAVSA